MKKRALTLLLILVSIVTYSQTEQTKTQNQIGLITLEKLVDTIKLENESLRNVKAVNVMVDDMLIENLQHYLINPINIEAQEVLVLNINGANRASIIINTRNRQQITKL
ncbi:MAG: hypothetical protein ABIQ27_14325 [Flavobacterium sp.]|uniref:hypothetical protein n=1 Tax=Flavobacterium sp. TaxID=239 RepID=UPI0032642D45